MGHQTGPHFKYHYYHQDMVERMDATARERKRKGKEKEKTIHSDQWANVTEQRIKNKTNTS